ncbi:gp16 family protein [Paraburkholderia fungorum]|uniref:gp16 family protein n=3 Tax=Paraburkholderia fungorum TaxID=134537 RepID=UPI00402B97F5
MTQQRTRELAQIHIAIKQIGMSEDDHRALLSSVCGVTSAGELDDAGRRAYLAHLKKLGFKPVRRAGERTQADDAQSRKIRAIWLTLHALGAVRNPSESALAAYVQRTTRVAALQWLNARQTETVIESLKKWAMRYLPGAVAALEARLEQACPSETDAVQAARQALLKTRKFPSFEPMMDAWEALRIASGEQP